MCLKLNTLLIIIFKIPILYLLTILYFYLFKTLQSSLKFLDFYLTEYYLNLSLKSINLNLNVNFLVSD